MCRFSILRCASLCNLLLLERGRTVAGMLHPECAAQCADNAQLSRVRDKMNTLVESEGIAIGDTLAHMVVDSESTSLTKETITGTPIECIAGLELDDGQVGLNTGEKPVVNVQHRKSFKTAVCIIPPEEVWEQIQNIRRTHDKAYERWMPHINLLFPFITDYEAQLQDAAHKIKTGMVPIVPFKVTFNKDSFGYFSHKKKAVLWLKPFWKHCNTEKQTDVNDTAGSNAANYPATSPHNPSVLEIQKRLEILFPEFSELSSRTDKGFQPHLTLGQFRPKDVERVKVQYHKDWSDFEFEVKEVYIISRSDFYDPFHVRYAVPLGHGPALSR